MFRPHQSTPVLRPLTGTMPPSSFNFHQEDRRCVTCCMILHAQLSLQGPSKLLTYCLLTSPSFTCLHPPPNHKSFMQGRASTTKTTQPQSPVPSLEPSTSAPSPNNTACLLSFTPTTVPRSSSPGLMAYSKHPNAITLSTANRFSPRT